MISLILILSVWSIAGIVLPTTAVFVGGPLTLAWFGRYCVSLYGRQNDYRGIVKTITLIASVAISIVVIGLLIVGGYKYRSIFSQIVLFLLLSSGWLAGYLYGVYRPCDYRVRNWFIVRLITAPFSRTSNPMDGDSHVRGARRDDHSKNPKATAEVAPWEIEE